MGAEGSMFRRPTVSVAATRSETTTAPMATLRAAGVPRAAAKRIAAATRKPRSARETVSTTSTRRITCAIACTRPRKPGGPVGQYRRGEDAVAPEQWRAVEPGRDARIVVRRREVAVDPDKVSRDTGVEQDQREHGQRRGDERQQHHQPYGPATGLVPGEVGSQDGERNELGHDEHVRPHARGAARAAAADTAPATR